MGRAVSSPRSFPDSATSSDRATFVAISPCTRNTSERSASNASCHRVVGAPPPATSTSSDVRRIRLAFPDFCQRTLATSR